MFARAGLTLALWTSLLLLASCDRGKPPPPGGGGPVTPPPVAGGGAPPVRTVPSGVTPTVGVPGWRKDLQGAAVPAVPAAGQISGRPFVVEKATIEDGILKLRQGQDFFADLEITVFLFLDKGALPSGKTYTCEGGEPFSAPHIHMGYKPEGADMPKTEAFMNRYWMTLAFGEAKDNTVPGKIYLCLPDAAHSWVAGTFTAAVEGFRLVDGKADTTSDSFDTLKSVVAAYVSAQNEGQPAKIHESRSAQYETTAGVKRRMGKGDYRVAVGDGEPRWMRFLFAREETGWAVAATLTMDQFPAAHPVIPPDAEKDLSRYLEHLAAVEAENDLAARMPGRALFEVSVGCNTWNTKLAAVNVSYKIEGDEKETQRRFVYRNDGSGWALDREMQENEQLDWKTGEIRVKAGK